MVAWLRNYLLLALLAAMCVPSAQAATSTVLLNEGFSSATFPPTGWTSQYYGFDRGWYRSSEGYGGNNGAAFVDIYNSYDDFSRLYSPKINLSGYAKSTDTAFVDFDFWFEYNKYNQIYGSGADDIIHVYVINSLGQKELLKLTTTPNYTFNNPTYNYYTAPTTATSDWKHYKIGIPAAYRTATTQILFEVEPYYGLSGTAVDNVMITGVNSNKISYAPATPINFGALSVGDTSAPPRCIVLSNPSSATITISNVVLGGANPAAFTIVRRPSTLAPGTDLNPTKDSICIVANPKVAGLRQATISFSSNDDFNTGGNIGLSVNGVAPSISSSVTTLYRKSRTTLGSCYQQSFLVTNTGQAGLLKFDPVATTISGDYPNEYRIVRLPTVGIPPGASDTVTVSYCPTIEGGRPAYLNLVSNASNGNFRVDLFGTGVLPRLVISPSPLHFDSVAVGEEVCRNITLANTGTDTLRISRFEFVSRDGDFTTAKFLDSVILPETSKMLSVCFRPIQFGSRFATIKVSTNIPRTFDGSPRDTSSFFLNIDGTGVPFGKFGFTGNTGTDSVLVGTEICRTDTITNTGTADLTLTSGNISGGDSSDFVISGITYPVVIRPGASKAVTICSTPGAAGNRTSQLTITGTTGGEPFSVNLPLSVFGQTACASASPLSAFKAPVLVSTSETTTITVTNCGEVASTYQATLDNPAYTIVGSSMSPLVAPGATTTFDVKFTPTAMGAAPGKLTLTTAGVSPIVIDLNGVGGAVVLSGTGTAPNTAVGATSPEFSVTIQNDGNVDFTPGVPAVSGPYTYVSGGNTPIAAGTSGTLMFTFTPTKGGTNIGQATFPAGSPATSFQLNLSGQGIAASVRDVVPAGFALGQNYPNPFTPNTVISFTIPTESNVSIVISDVKGNVVQTVAGRYGAGSHDVKIEGNSLSSGTYFYTLYSGDAVITKQMTRQK